MSQPSTLPRASAGIKEKNKKRRQRRNNMRRGKSKARE
jgi:hypothetical protein